MVLLTQVLSCSKNLPRKFLRRGLLDTLRLHVKAGAGGSGWPTCGGLGGPGGNVYVVSHSNVKLETIRSKLKTMKLVAEHGAHSSKKAIFGEAGTDLNIRVPVGITVYTEDGVKLGELNKGNEKLMVAKGGIGGCPDTQFCGLRGQDRTIVLDLKLIADVGLVGFPNAGKSTFINQVTNSKSRIASYPFTTIKPQVGIMHYEDYRTISIADLPGLIEGAHKNTGMGHKFLKHLERTKLLLMIVDIQGFQLSLRHTYRSCLDTVVLLNKEIELYNPDLLLKPAMLIVNKMDTTGAHEIYREIKPKLENLADYVHDCDKSLQPEKILQFDDIFSTSLNTGDMSKISLIKDRIRSVIDKYAEDTTYGDVDPREKELIERLKRRSEQCAPTLV